VLLDIPMLTILAPALIVTMWQPLKERITTPRLGYVRFSEPRRKRERRGLRAVHWALVGTALAGIAVWLMFDRGGDSLRETMSGLGLAPFALMVALLLGVAGLAFRAPWFLGYALLAVVAAALVPLGVPGEYGLTGVGAAITFTGLARLIRFIRRYPPRPAGASS
jgi:hypothetical protein